MTCFRLRFFLSFTVLLSVAGCAIDPMHNSVPTQLSERAVVDGFPADIRSWSDEARDDLAQTIQDRVARYKQENAEYFAEYKHYPPMNYLALSGGSSSGAFAAGALSGWSKSGARPQFSVVTGVSTGALIAPFAFLGPQYDETLRTEYTTVHSDNIFLSDVWTVLKGLRGGLSFADNTPLKKRIDTELTQQVLDAIAVEHRKGRRLLIVTTNLEAQRGVVWNIGRIANSRNPKRLDLVKQIMLASAAVPGMFEPVLINVDIEGKNYQEIHVDGGVTSQVFLFPLQTSRMDKEAFAKSGIERNLYIIRSGKVSAEYEAIKPTAISLSQRSLDSIIKYQAVGDLYRLYIAAQRDGMNYKLLYIPPQFNEKSKEIFDPDYMRKLFEIGCAEGVKGIDWVSEPPGYGYTDAKVKAQAR